MYMTEVAKRWEEVRAGIQKIILHKHLLGEDTIKSSMQPTYGLAIAINSIIKV